MKLAICIPDPTYDQAGPENASEIFQKDLEKTFRQKFTPVDIGAGADWPAFQTMIELSPILAVPLGLFFLGEKIEKNFTAWANMARTIGKYFVYRPVLDKNAAAILAVDLVDERLGRSSKSMRLTGFKTTHGPVDELYTDPQFSGVMQLDGREDVDYDLRRLDGIVYWFNIEADGVAGQSRWPARSLQGADGASGRPRIRSGS